ncbi:MAG: hypothetical protein OER82_09765 [Nitrosopumilus sp.]|nr:hypothetical protein [Nitrosopumilus sp.]
MQVSYPKACPAVKWLIFVILIGIPDKTRLIALLQDISENTQMFRVPSYLNKST